MTRPAIVDHHAHSAEYSPDSRVPMADLVRAVAARGFAPSVSDHYPNQVSWYGKMGGVAALPGYLSAIDAVAAETGIAVLRALELEIGCKRTELDVASLRRLDHLVAGYHDALPHLPVGRLHRMHAALDEIETELTTRPVDILAHPLRYLAGASKPSGEVPDEIVARLVAILVATGTALELNGKSGHPHDAVIRAALEAGVQLAVGTDIHAIADVDRTLEGPMATLARFGVREDELFDARVPKQLRRSAARWAVALGELVSSPDAQAQLGTWADDGGQTRDR